MTLAELIPIILSVLTGISGWAIGRRKTAAEADTNELENVERSLSIYRSIVDDLRKEMGLLRVELSTNTEQNVLLLKENRELKQQLEGVQRTLNTIQNQH